MLISFSCTLIAISSLLIWVEITPLESIIGHLALRRIHGGIIQVNVWLGNRLLFMLRLLLMSVLHWILNWDVLYWVVDPVLWGLHFYSSSRAWSIITSSWSCTWTGSISSLPRSFNVRIGHWLEGALFFLPLIFKFGWILILLLRFLVIKRLRISFLSNLSRL